MPVDCDSKEYWERRFRQADTPWELGGPTALLSEGLQLLPELPGYRDIEMPLRVVCAGVGRGDDALELARCGFDVVAVEWSDLAVLSLRDRGEYLTSPKCGSLTIEHGDFFQVPPRQVDFAFEHTFFCALPPHRRPEYVKAMSNWLKAGRVLIGNFFIEQQGDSDDLQLNGPPFFVKYDELVTLFTREFKVLRLSPVPQKQAMRRGDFEWLGVFERV